MASLACARRSFSVHGPLPRAWVRFCCRDDATRREVIDHMRRQITQRTRTSRTCRSPSRYPCRVNPGNPTLHYWTPAPAATPGWFTCGCGAVGVCEGCLAKSSGKREGEGGGGQGGQRPAAAVAIWCRQHHETVCGKRMPLSSAACLAV